MPDDGARQILGVNSALITPPIGEEAIIGFTTTVLGPALLCAISGAPIVVVVDLDLADDEVAIGGPDSGGTRRLFQGRVDGGNNIQEMVPVLTGAQALALGKVDDTAFASGDVGSPTLLVKRLVPAAAQADADYMPQTGDAAGATWIRERKPTVVPLGTSIAVVAAQITTGAANDDRFTVTFFNNSVNTIYLGPTGVTVANGLPLLRGASMTLEATIEWFAIASVAGPSDLRVLEQSY